MGLIEVFAVVVSVGFGYLFFRLIKINIYSGNKSLQFAQLFFAWSVFISTSIMMPQFLLNPDQAHLFAWLAQSLVFGLLAFFTGFLYGRFK